MSGLNCTLWVYITPNVPVMEIQYATPCDACLTSQGYTATKEGILTTMPKEPLAKFLVWAKIELT